MGRYLKFAQLLVFAILSLMILNIVYAKKKVILDNVEKPDSFFVDKKNLYLVDGWSIKIYSRDNFKFKRKFGGNGEGPGEFKGYIISSITPDYIFVNTPGRVSYFSLEGNFIKQKTTNYPFGRFKTVGKDNFVGYSYSKKDGQRYEAIYLYDKHIKKTKRLYLRKHFVSKKGKINLIEERPPFFQIYQNKIYLDGIDGRIYVYNKNGKVLNILKPKIDRLPFTIKHKNKFEKQLEQNVNTKKYYHNTKKRFTYPDMFPPIRMFHVKNKKIYIMTNLEKEKKNEFIILDINGKEIKRIFLPISPFEKGMILLNYDICEDKLYQLIDNEKTEEWEIIIYDL